MRRLIDGRALSPPEPLELTVAALDELADADELCLLVHCRPQPLYAILQRHGYRWTETVTDDGAVEVVIRRRP
jgi:hypothetical protein